MTLMPFGYRLVWIIAEHFICVAIVNLYPGCPGINHKMSTLGRNR